MKRPLILLGIVALVLALLALLLPLRGSSQVRHIALALCADGPYLHADGAILRDAQGHTVSPRGRRAPPSPCAAQRAPPPSALERMRCGDLAILSGLWAPCCPPSAGDALRSRAPLATMDHHPDAPLPL